ncbi:MAG TPA: cell division protein FtsQ/DivIB, partial [Gaiellaceae bacterium]|nr:cell division protein FtsQ/DivIB [Gaiellaceae bacterium]
AAGAELTRVTKIALALARPQPLAFALPARSLRVLAAAAAAAALAALAYAGATRTTLFAVERIDVSGAPPDVAREIRATLSPFEGTSLVRLDEKEIVARVKALPSVRAVEYDRAFPSTLRLVVRAGEGAWLVSDRGRIIRPVEPESSRVPRIRWQGGTPPDPGTTIDDRELRVALEVVAALPAEFPARVVSAQVEEGEPVLVLASGGQVRLGSAESVELKLAAAARVLAALPADERAGLAYVDVSVPARVVASLKSQAES